MNKENATSISGRFEKAKQEQLEKESIRRSLIKAEGSIIIL